MRRAAAAALLTGIFGAVPAVANAGEVFLAQTPPLQDTPTIFRAFGGETNDLTVTGGFGFEVSDAAAPLTVGPGCTAQPDGSALCEPPSSVLEVRLKAADDAADVSITGTATIWAGPGDDTVTADSFCCLTTVYGQSGDDDVTAGGEGGQLADGGPGDDTVNAGGFAGDGTGLGGPGDDIISFRSFLQSRAILEGGSGDDSIVSLSRAGGTVAGGSGDDVISIGGTIPMFDVDRSFTITGGSGRDDISVIQGDADTVSCGSGVDVVHYEAGDTIAADCEILLGP